MAICSSPPAAPSSGAETRATCTSTPAAMAWRSAHFEASAAAAAPFLAACRRESRHAHPARRRSLMRRRRLQYQSRHPAAVRAARRVRPNCRRCAPCATSPAGAVLNSFGARRADAAAVVRGHPPGQPRRPRFGHRAGRRAAPTVGLLEAMRLAAGRDRIAAAYLHDLREISSSSGCRVLANARGSTDDPSLAVTTLHMAYLAYFPDSHIARKYGTAAAETVRAGGARAVGLWQPVAQPQHAGPNCSISMQS